MIQRWLVGVAAVALVTAFSGAQAQTVQTVRDGNTIVTFQATAPGVVVSSVAVTGLDPLTTIAAIDYRSSSPRVLYAMSNVGQLYVVNTRTGAATKVGATPATPTIGGVGFDFNPTVDRLRVVTQTRQNFRVHPDTGALVAVDGTLAYAAGDPLSGAIVNVAGAAYTNPVVGATSTTLYVIDTRGALAPAQLATQGNATAGPNTGTLFSVGSTNVTTLGNVGFDISREGTALATMTSPGTRVTSLYSINLTTGAATLIGALGGNMLYEGLAIALAPFATMGTTANQVAVGGQIDQFVGIPRGDTLALLNGIDNLFATPGAQSAALSALSPAAFSPLTEIALNAAEVSETTILRYARSVRGGGIMPDGSTAMLDSQGRVGAWIAGGGREGSFEQAVDRPEFDFHGFHGLGGLDVRIGEASALGVFGGYSNSAVRLTPLSQRSGVESWFTGVYGTASLGPVFLDAWGSYTDVKFDLTRSLSFGGFSAQPTGQTDGEVWAGGASAGLSIALGAVRFEPFAAIRYAEVKIDGFSEAGGSVAALNVLRQERESLRSNVGARLGFGVSDGNVVFRPEIRGGWYHEFRDDPAIITANFLSNSIGTGSFPFTGTAFDRDYYNAGASLDVTGGGPFAVVFDYEAQFDFNGGREIHAITAGARLAF